MPSLAEHLVSFGMSAGIYETSSRNPYAHVSLNTSGCCWSLMKQKKRSFMPLDKRWRQRYQLKYMLFVIRDIAHPFLLTLDVR